MQLLVVINGLITSVSMCFRRFLMDAVNLLIVERHKELPKGTICITVKIIVKLFNLVLPGVNKISYIQSTILLTDCLLKLWISWATKRISSVCFALDAMRLRDPFGNRTNNSTQMTQTPINNADIGSDYSSVRIEIPAILNIVTPDLNAGKSDVRQLFCSILMYLG